MDNITIPDFTDEQENILEEIQINSYNLNQQFLRLNEEILQSQITTDSAIQTNHIERIDLSVNILVILVCMSIIFNFIKLRGERNLWL